MSEDPQPGPPGWPFGPGFDLSQMMRMLHSEGPVNWDVASQIAGWVALADPDTGEVATEPPVDSETRARLTELLDAARHLVADATRLPATHGLQGRVVDRKGWAEQTLDGLRPVLETLARTLQSPAADLGDEPGAADPFGGLLAALAPTLLGVQAGSMVGFLAQQALGQFDLPLPLAGEPELLVVGGNLSAFAEEWELDRDDVAFAFALREVAHGAERSVPWVREMVVRLAQEYVSGYRVDDAAIEDQLGDIDVGDPSSFAGIMGDPTALLGAIRTPRQDGTLEQIQRLGAVLEGYVDTIVEQVGASLVPSFARVDEALRRQRVDRGRATAFVEQLLGLELRREHYEAGQAFCAGVVERAGLEGIHRLWEGPALLPTPPELEAPGLWLARIELDA